MEVILTIIEQARHITIKEGNWQVILHLLKNLIIIIAKKMISISSFLKKENNREKKGDSYIGMLFSYRVKKWRKLERKSIRNTRSSHKRVSQTLMYNVMDVIDFDEIRKIPRRYADDFLKESFKKIKNLMTMRSINSELIMRK